MTNTYVCLICRRGGFPNYDAWLAHMRACRDQNERKKR